MTLDNKQGSELQTLNVFHHTEAMFELHRVYLHIYLVYGIRKIIKRGGRHLILVKIVGKKKLM